MDVPERTPASGVDDLPVDPDEAAQTFPASDPVGRWAGPDDLEDDDEERSAP